MERKILIAGKGKILTNGEIYGKKIYLGKGETEQNFKEITETEYKNFFLQQSHICD